MELPNIKGEMLKRAFKNDFGKDFMKIQADLERRLMQQANSMLETCDLGYQIQVPSEDKRAEQLVEGIASMMDQNIHRFYVEQYYEHRLNCESLSSVLTFFDMSEEMWEQACDSIIEDYTEMGYFDPESDDRRMMMNEHIKESFGVSVDEFEEQVVFWDYEKKKDTLKRMFGGDAETDEIVIFRGLDTVRESLEDVHQDIKDNRK